MTIYAPLKLSELKPPDHFKKRWDNWRTNWLGLDEKTYKLATAKRTIREKKEKQ